MDYKIKDIYITILPGLNLIMFVVLALMFQGCINICTIESSFYWIITEMWSLVALMLPLFSIMVGYSIHIIGSALIKQGFGYHPLSKAINTLYKSEQLTTLYAEVKTVIDEHRLLRLQPSKDDLQKEQLKETLHIVKDLLEPNEKIEEYFVRHAQAQNMLMSEIIALLVQIVLACSCYHCVEPNVCGNILLLLVHVILICFYSLAFKRNFTRYEEVVWAEFVKYVEKKSNNK